MARPIKNTVDYFPHYVKSGRTIFILESMYGNDGYAFWFKLLEILGDSEGHFYDCSSPNNWAYLLAKTQCDEKTATAIIETLLNLGKIDSQLWIDHRIIWSQRFVENVSSVYKLRHADIPKKPSYSNEKPKEVGVSIDRNPEGCELIDKEIDIVEYSIEEKRKEKKRKEIPPPRVIVELWNETCGDVLPRVKALNDNRRQKIKKRLEEFEDNDEAVDVLAYTRALFERVAASRFLCGENKNNWAATFDWLFENASNWVKVVEGNYDNDRGEQGAAKQQTAAHGVTLGVGEYLTPTGQRTYGTGIANIPPTAPPRPSERYGWDAASESWILT